MLRTLVNSAKIITSIRNNVINSSSGMKSSCFPSVNVSCSSLATQSSLCNTASFHTSLPRSKVEGRKEMLASTPTKDEGTEGEKLIVVDSMLRRYFSKHPILFISGWKTFLGKRILTILRDDVFPDEDTPNKLFDGIPFSEIPICHIRASPNNTILSISNSKGEVKMLRSCGMEGFKNTRKGTNIAAQATAISLSTSAVSQGYKTVRVKVQGLGPGRMSAIKGLQMGGLNIISITDNTRVSWNPPRPRKQKKL